MRPMQELIEDIATDQHSGASELAIQALEAIRWAVRSSQAVGIDSFVQEVQATAQKLSGCRPSMAVIGNSMQRFKRRLNNLADGSASLAAQRSRCEKIIDELEQELLENKRKSISNAADFIKSCSAITTCSYSSTLIAALHTAAAQGKKISVRILQSQSGTISYGQKTRQALAASGIECRIVDDESMEESLPGADMVLLGSDTVFRNGSVVNGYPSLQLSRLASMHQPPIPVYVVSDSSKICSDILRLELETGFDLIPAGLLTGLITEDGLVKRQEASAYLESHFSGS